MYALCYNSFFIYSFFLYRTRCLIYTLFIYLIHLQLTYYIYSTLMGRTDLLFMCRIYFLFTCHIQYLFISQQFSFKPLSSLFFFDMYQISDLPAKVLRDNKDKDATRCKYSLLPAQTSRFLVLVLDILNVYSCQSIFHNLLY